MRPADPAPPVLEVSNYSLTYQTPSGPLQALKAIDLSVPHGQTHGLVGESGSGKSSLAWAILRYLPETAVENDGRILLSNENLRDRTLPEILEIRGRRISMVYQDPSTSLNPAMRLGEQLSEVLIRHRGLTPHEAMQEAEAGLARTGITKPKEMLRRYPHEASGGEKQRVVIATAFACNPELIIFDEPTTALDIITAQQFLDLFRRLQEETQVSALYISHDLGLVARVADQVSVLNRGEIVESGTRTEVFRRPQNAYTKALIAAVPDPAQWRGVAEPAPETPTLLETRGITVEYGRQGLVGRLLTPKPTHLGAQDITLDVRKGELVGLVGESGSGKSTMAKVLAGLLEFDGAVRFDDRD
jgi:peptide/nickel transport system ATP-binding protein